MSNSYKIFQLLNLVFSTYLMDKQSIIQHWSTDHTLITWLILTHRWRNCLEFSTGKPGAFLTHELLAAPGLGTGRGDVSYAALSSRGWFFQAWRADPRSLPLSCPLQQLLEFMYLIVWEPCCQCGCYCGKHSKYSDVWCLWKCFYSTLTLKW